MQDVLAAAGFKENPFRIVPPNEMENILWAGDRSQIDNLIEAARSPRSDNLSTSELVVLYGDFGSGKTNALKLLYKQLIADRELVAYLINPLVADKPGWHDVVRTLFTRAFQRDDVIERLKPLRRWALVEADNRARSQLGRGADPDSLRSATERAKKETYQSIAPELPGFAEFALDLCDPQKQDTDRNWSYLTAKPSAALGTTMSNLYGLPPEGMSSDYSATLLLASLVKVITFEPNGDADFQPGARTVCLLMDEMEDLQDLPNASRYSIQQGLRDLFNTCTEHLFIALAATGSDASEMWGLLEQPLMQRLSRLPVEFPAMESGQARDFLLEIMKIYHAKADFKGPAEWPFTDDGLDAFVTLCRPPLTPRKLLLSAGRLLFQTYKEKILTGQAVDGDDVRGFTQWAG